MSDDQILLNDVSTLIGGVLDTFLVSAGPGVGVASKTAAQVRTLLGVPTTTTTDGLQAAVDGKAATVHTHPQSDITGLVAALTGKAATAHTHAQSDITGLVAALSGKAATAHTHAIADTTGLQAALDAKTATGHTHPQSDVTGLVAALAAKSSTGHTHPQSDVTGLVTDLAGKAAASHIHSIANTTGLQTALDGKTAVGHVHAIADTTGLQAALDDKATVASVAGKASTGHSHAQADITGLVAALTGKAPTSHTHAQSDVTSLVADLAGKAPTSHTHTIANTTGLQAALDGKTATGHTHVIANTTGLQAALDAKADNSSLAGFAATVHTHSQSQVTSLVTDLAGKAAAVHSHAQADVTGLVAALAGKSATGHTHSIAEVGSLQATLDGKASVASVAAKADTAHTHVIADTTGLQTALDGKAATSHTHTIANTTGLQAALDAKAATSHSHSQADVTGLVAALAATAAAVHTHAQADVTGLVAALAGKAATSHTHAIADTTGLQAAIDAKAATAHTHAQTDVTGLVAALAGKAATAHTHSQADVTSLVADLAAKAPLVSPVFVTPALGTPSSGVMTNVSGTATALTVGNATKLATPRTINGVAFDGTANITVAAAGTTLTDTVPTSKGGTGLTVLGTPAQIMRVNGAGTGLEWANEMTGSAVTSGTLAQFAATTSLQLKTLITDETGSGPLVFATSPVLVTPVLGAATATSINNTTIPTSATLLAQTNIGVDVQGYDAALNSFVALAGGANKLPYFTADDVLAQTDFTAAGRALVDDVDAAAQRTTLGLGTLATQNGTFSGTSSGTNTGDQTNISGNAATVTTNANLTGPVTSVGNATTIAQPILAAVAGLTGAANKGILFTGASSVDTFTLTAAALTVLDDASVAAMVDTLGGAAATGTGGIVRANGPTLTTPALGTPSSVVLTNATGLPISTGVTGLAANMATFLANPTSANLAATVTDETGSGALVLATSPLLVTPTLGNALATTINGTVIPTGASLLKAADIGVLVQAYDAELASFAGLTSAANKLPYFTGVGTAALADFTVAGRALLDDADAAAQRATLGLGTLSTQNGTFSGTSSGTNTGDQTITLSGDATGAGTGSLMVSLATLVGVVAAEYTNPTLTVDEKGRVTAIASGAGGGDALRSGTLAQFGPTTSGQLASVISDETGTGALVFATSPVLITPTLGAALATTINGTAIPASKILVTTDDLIGSGAGQPLDATLTAVAGVTTAADRLIYFNGVDTAAACDFTSAGRALLDDVDAAAQRVTLGLVIGTNVQAYDVELAALAGLASVADRVPYFTGSGTAALATCTAFARTLLDDVDAAAALVTLGIGGGYQAADATLTAMAGVVTAADRLIYFTGVDVAAAATLTTFGRSLIDDVDAAALRTTIGTVIGTDVQAYHANLAALAGLTTVADRFPYYTGSGTAALGTVTTFARTLLDDVDAPGMRTTLGLTIGTNVQAYDATLAAMAGAVTATDSIIFFTAADTASVATLTAAGRALLDDADAATQRATLGLVIGTNVQAYDAELAALAGLASAANKLPYFTGAGTAATADFTVAGRALLGDADAAAQRATLGLTIGTNVQAYDAELAALAGLTSAADVMPYFTGVGTAATTSITSWGRSLAAFVSAQTMLTGMGLAQIKPTADVLKLENGSNRQCFELMNYETSATALEGIRIKAVASSDYEIGSFQGSVSGSLRSFAFGGYARATPTVLTKWMDIASGEVAAYGGTASVKRFSDTTTACNLIFKKHRGTEDIPGALLSADFIGGIYFQGYSGSTLNNTASILGQAAGAYSTGDTPGRLLFATTPPGTTVPTTRMAITETGLISIGTWSTATPLDALVTLIGNNSTGNNTLRFHDLYNTIGIGNTLGKIEFYSGDASAPGVGVKAYISSVCESAGLANAAIVFATDTNTGAPIERMRINRLGNVGIGTTTPGQLLEVASDLTPAIRLTSTDTTATVSQVVGRLEIQGSDTDLVTPRPVGALQVIYITTAGASELQLSTSTGGAESVGARLTKEGWWGVGQSHTDGGITSPLDIFGNCFRVRTPRTPASAAAAGNAGEWCQDASYIYICTATNTWKRVAIATW